MDRYCPIRDKKCKGEKCVFCYNTNDENIRICGILLALDRIINKEQ